MKKIQEAYNRWAGNYDNQQNSTRDLDKKVLQRIFADIRNAAVIECGCGTGKNTEWLAGHCSELWALDFSEGMIAEAQKKVSAVHVRFVACDITSPWPSPCGYFDYVLFNLVLEHIENIEPVFAEAGNALKSGGMMILSEYHPDRVEQGKGAVNDKTGERISNFYHSTDDFIQIAEKAGMKLSECVEHSSDTEKPADLLVIVFQKK